MIISEENLDFTYLADFFTAEESATFFKRINDEVEWHRPSLKFGGKSYPTKRRVAWYSDEGFTYGYSGQTHESKDWTPALLEIKNRVEEFMICEKFDGVLLNHYENGLETVGPHSDDEKDMKKFAPVVGISFGSERDFVLKHKTKNIKHKFLLKPGSLYVMKGETQSFWKHSIPVRKKVRNARISLTYRQCIKNEKDPYDLI